MSRQVVSRLVPADGFASPQAALLYSALLDVHGRLRDATRGLTPEELAWQPGTPAPPAPAGPGNGMNSIGMLLAHIAVAETHLSQVGLLGEHDGHVHDVLGLTMDEEGMPLAAGAPPSPSLAGRDLAYFDDLQLRALEAVRRATLPLDDAAIAGDVVRPPREDGTQRVFDRRWILHHMVEHTAGHLGQIQLIRHLYRLARSPEAPRSGTPPR